MTSLSQLLGIWRRSSSFHFSRTTCRHLRDQHSSYLFHFLCCAVNEKNRQHTRIMYLALQRKQDHSVINTLNINGPKDAASRNPRWNFFPVWELIASPDPLTSISEIVVNQFGGFIFSSIVFEFCRYQIVWHGVKCLRKVHRFNSDNIVLIKFVPSLFCEAEKSSISSMISPVRKYMFVKNIVQIMTGSAVD